MTAKLGSLAAMAASALGSPLAPGTSALVARWLAHLQAWNARIDLTAARTDEELVDLMIGDALAIAPHLPPGGRLVDIGAGAGAPGLALALLRPDLRVTLVEVLGKRASFLRSVIGDLSRLDVGIERRRGETLPPGAWEIAVSRATLPPPAWLDLGVHLAAPGGIVWVFLAQEGPPSHARASIERDITYEWPMTHARRRAVGYRLLPP